LRDKNRLARLETVLLPHLDAAYNLARWLTGKDHDAEDVVQEAYLRACRFFEGFHGTDGRAWLLTIVRNACYTWLKQNRPQEPALSFDEATHSTASGDMAPEIPLMQGEDRQMVRNALEDLPPEFREVIVLRELEGMSYKEVATVTGVPIGTVMSRLARARDRLQQSLDQRMIKEP
jgi:RNA polymerase sigma-70 factor (ECF subfamily)